MTSRLSDSEAIRQSILSEKEVCVYDKIHDKKIGRGSYASIWRVDYKGLKCAGKQIHEVLLEQGEEPWQVKRFEEECQLLSQVRHPNIVQFLGLHFKAGEKVPILIMEYLPTNLADSIKRYGAFLDEISYSILHDVALGLCYLHSHHPDPIIHRDLSSNNILLTMNMIAKISDLGVARIVNLSQKEAQRMTRTPGTPAFMPPEVAVDDPVYGSGVDIFSYGVVMIHIFTGKWPTVHVQQARMEGGQLIPYTEAERRAEYLNIIGDNHILMDLIKKCIHNDPNERPTAREIVNRVSKLVSDFPLSFNNQLELLQMIKEYENHRIELEERKSGMILQVKEKSKQLQLYKEKIDNIQKAHGTQTESLHLKIEGLKKEIETLRIDNLYMESKVESYSNTLHGIQLSLQGTQQYISDLEEQTSETFQLNFSFALPMSQSRPPVPPIPSSRSLVSIKETQKEDPVDSSQSSVSKVESSSDVTNTKHGDTKTKWKESSILTNVSKKQLTFIEKLESGHMCTVWKGVMNKYTNVAIKQLKPGVMSIEEYSKQATIMNKLHHPNVIKLLAVCTTEDAMYIVTDPMKCSLLQYLRVEETRSLSPSSLINMSMQVAEGMIYLGKEKCIHRDLAARNVILVGGTLTCKIANFELAKIAQDGIIEADSNFRFPIKWTACETLAIYPHVSTTKSDVWSFGILLWELITHGSLPYSKMTNQQSQREVMNGYRMPCPAGCSKRIYTLMLKCWREEPVDRPTFMELLQQLKEVSRIKHASKPQSDLQIANAPLYMQREAIIYECVSRSHAAEFKESINLKDIQGSQSETVYIQGSFWNKDRQKQHVQVTEEMKWMNAGYFKVFKGIWNKSTPVAIKTYAPSTMSAAEFIQQATIMAKLQHTNVCKFYAAFRTHQSMYAVTELIEMNLSTYLQSQSQAPTIEHKDLVKLSLHIADGMIYVGEQNCILRNLCACNILIQSSNDSESKFICKISNLDQAQIAECDIILSDPESKFPVRWTAPEAIVHGHFSTKSDVWSFGILLWEIITHSMTPYPAMTNGQVREQLHEGYHMPCPNECPERLYSIMLECWNENPKDRPNFQVIKSLILEYLNEVSEIYGKHSQSVKEKLYDDSDYEDSSSIIAQLADKNPVYEATSDHDAKESNEVSLKKGDILSIKGTNDIEGWSWGISVISGREGFIPNSSIPKQPLIVFNKKKSKGTYNQIWDALWKGLKPSTVRLVEETSSYTAEIIELRHTNIVEIYIIYSPKYIVMEPMKHGKLDEFLQTEGYTLKLSQLITMCTQISAAMAYLEEKNCILRNLAARNILVGDRLICKISNFSSARFVTRSYDSTEGGIYTYAESGVMVYEDQKYTRIAIKWAAPEAANNNRFSSRSDMWSFGVVLSEIITLGSMPYPKMTNQETLDNVTKGYRMPRPADCPEKLYSIMLNCWNSQFTERPSFSSVNQMLENYFSE